MSSSIADIQSKKEAEIQPKYASPTDSQNEVTLRKQSEADAAKTLQRTYRGYRARRQLQGLSLDPASRWIEVFYPAVKEAQYRALTTPQSRGTDTNTISSTTDPSSPPFPQPGLQHRTSTAKSNWAFAGKIARRANKAEDSSPSGSSSSDSDVGAHDVSNTPTSARPPTDAQKRARKQKKLAEKQDRVKSAKTMDLSYFLEMVDQKHRYGSNLRKYHAYWKAQEGVYENFFFWLDHGAGKDVVVEACSRERLEEMRVRYLGKEERRLYEVVVGEGGSLFGGRIMG
ncbi:uncharacterized protein KY384_008565 [Bacidia gigantensis]|uniref:uncharacterized protein n=1 Tax=Bacidia gigantensis TaxID=2732470 RepID=UPI001D05A25A|nr:uncharacterized protein KY384_008565 [Bacidia gigantensis]KAG8527136.1 hypothetical protein KY384_008565 [Bacidia gigantensis]